MKLLIDIEPYTIHQNSGTFWQYTIHQYNGTHRGKEMGFTSEREAIAAGNKKALELLDNEAGPGRTRITIGRD